MKAKYVIVETRVYEIEAKDGPDAVKKFHATPDAKRELVSSKVSCEDWFTNDRKDKIATIVRDALEGKLGDPWSIYNSGVRVPHDHPERWWDSAKKILESVKGWKAGEWEKFEDNNIHGISNQKIVEVGIEEVDEEIWYVSIPREDALKILVMGVPF